MYRLISMYKTLGVKIVCVLYLSYAYQPMIFNIRGPHQTLQYFHWIERGLHSKDFQPSLKEVNIPHELTSANRVAIYFLAQCCILWTVF